MTALLTFYEAIKPEDCLSFVPEEPLKNLSAFFLKNSAGDFNLVVQPFVLEQREKGSNASSLWVLHPENEAPDPRLKEGPGTHDTGFKRHIQGAFRKPKIPHLGRCLP